MNRAIALQVRHPRPRVGFLPCACIRNFNFQDVLCDTALSPVVDVGSDRPKMRPGYTLNPIHADT